jgi:hypothetical protein
LTLAIADGHGFTPSRRRPDRTRGKLAQSCSSNVFLTCADGLRRPEGPGFGITQLHAVHPHAANEGFSNQISSLDMMEYFAIKLLDSLDCHHYRPATSVVWVRPHIPPLHSSKIEVRTFGSWPGVKRVRIIIGAPIMPPFTLSTQWAAKRRLTLCRIKGGEVEQF